MNFEKKLLVFVSSTFSDLHTERQAAVSAILKAGHIPAGMELFTAGDRSQLDTIRAWIDQCDVYMLVLGGRYGSIEPLSNVSYTELEYDYAVEQEKPLFSVVITEDALEFKVRDVGTSVIEKDNPKQLAQFREKVLSNISSFYDDEKDIKLCVHKSLGEFYLSRNLTGWVRGDALDKISSDTDELQALREENARLSEEISKLKSKTPKTKDEEFKEITKALLDIEVVVPGHLLDKDEDWETNLLNVTFANKDLLVSGVANQATGSDASSFLYFNVMPKLQIHGLAENQKVSGVQWRRSVLTEKGMTLMAYMEKQKVLSQSNNAKASE